jgi:hypothetical protein
MFDNNMALIVKDNRTKEEVSQNMWRLWFIIILIIS